MTEMIERVARALYEQKNALGQWDENFVKYFAWDGPNFKGQDHFRRIARAAIEAMREPTEAMKDNDVIDPAYYGSCPTCGGAKQSWPAMIDAALGKVDARS